MKNNIYSLVRTLMILSLLFVVGCKGKNQPPTCVITKPSNNAKFSANQHIEVTVVAEDLDGKISEVRLYVDDVEYGVEVTAPCYFYVDASDFTAGTHTLKAVAKDNDGSKAESLVNITITAPPTCSIKSPQNNAQFKMFDVFTIRILADGVIDKLQVYIDNEEVYYDYDPEFPCDLSTYIGNAGTHKLKAVVTDDYGLEASAVVTVKINSFVVGEHALGGVIAYIDNSSIIVAAQNDLTGTYTWSNASYTCNALNLNGYTDWRLPTLDEAHILYQNRNLIGGFTGDRYWTRSEASYDYAYYMDFSYGGHNSTVKNSTYKVRPVRVYDIY